MAPSLATLSSDYSPLATTHVPATQSTILWDKDVTHLPGPAAAMLSPLGCRHCCHTPPGALHLSTLLQDPLAAAAARDVYCGRCPCPVTPCSPTPVYSSPHQHMSLGLQVAMEGWGGGHWAELQLHMAGAAITVLVLKLPLSRHLHSQSRKWRPQNLLNLSNCYHAFQTFALEFRRPPSASCLLSLPTTYKAENE